MLWAALRQVHVQTAPRASPTTSECFGKVVPYDAVEYGGGHYRREQVSLPDASSLPIIALMGGALVRFARVFFNHEELLKAMRDDKAFLF